MRTRIAVVCVVLLCTWLAASMLDAADEQYDFTLLGDASFNKAHGGQAIQMVVIHGPTRKVMGRVSGTVSSTADPSFSLTIPKALLPDDIHEVRYWIDSNFGGGRLGACDPKSIDHQWVTEATALKKSAVTTKVKHFPTAMAEVCQSFGGK